MDTNDCILNLNIIYNGKSFNMSSENLISIDEIKNEIIKQTNLEEENKKYMKLFLKDGDKEIIINSENDIILYADDTDIDNPKLSLNLLLEGKKESEETIPMEPNKQYNIDNISNNKNEGETKNRNQEEKDKYEELKNIIKKLYNEIEILKNEHNNNNTKNIEQDHLMIKNEYIEFRKEIELIKNNINNNNIINNRKQNEEIEKLKNDIKNEYNKMNEEQIKSYKNLEKLFDKKMNEFDEFKNKITESINKKLNEINDGCKDKINNAIKQNNLMNKDEFIEIKKEINQIKSNINNNNITNNRKQGEEIEKLKNDIKNEYNKIKMEQIKEYQNLKILFENKIKETDTSKIHYNEPFPKIINEINSDKKIIEKNNENLQKNINLQEKINELENNYNMLSISIKELDEKFLKNYTNNIYGCIKDLENKINTIAINFFKFVEKANEDRKLKEKFEISENISINIHDLDKNNKSLNSNKSCNSDNIYNLKDKTLNNNKDNIINNIPNNKSSKKGERKNNSRGCDINNDDNTSNNNINYNMKNNNLNISNENKISLEIKKDDKNKEKSKEEKQNININNQKSSNTDEKNNVDPIKHLKEKYVELRDIPDERVKEALENNQGDISKILIDLILNQSTNNIFN